MLPASAAMSRSSADSADLSALPCVLCVVQHGAEEAQHIMEDRAKEAMDKAKYKTGL